MNAELLHAIADALYSDLKATDTIKRLTELRDSLKGQVDQPQQPEHQQRTSERLAELQTALAQSAVNEFSPSWMQRVEELGVAHLFGDQLRQALSEIFQRNQITVATALEEVDGLRQQTDQARESLVFLIDGFSGLGVGKLELEPGEFEIGVTVPRTAVDSELGELAKEFALLNKILLPFSELATGTRPPFPVRSISSSDFGVLLETLGPTAAAIAFAVERLTTWYKRLLEIRILRQGLAEQGLSDAQLENVDAHADSHMEDGIDATIQELFGHFGFQRGVTVASRSQLGLPA